MEPGKLTLKREDFLLENELDARIYGYIAKGFSEGEDFEVTLKVQKGWPTVLALAVDGARPGIRAKCLIKIDTLGRLANLKKEVAEELATVADKENFRLVLEYEPEGGEEIMKTDKGQENMDLEEAFLIGWQKETRPYRILAYIMLAISALYFAYLIYEDKSLLNMLPLIIPIGFLPGEIFLGNFLQKKRK